MKRYALISCAALLLALAPGADASVPNRAPVKATAQLRVSPDLVRGSFNAPVLVTSVREGRNRMYVVEQGGKIKAFAPGKKRWTYLNVGSRVRYGGEQGLLGLAFSPTFREDKRLFVTYTRDDGALVLARYKVGTATSRKVEKSTRRTVLVVPHPDQGNHNGGNIVFGPGGDLYLGTGDGGGGGDPYDTAGRLSELRGKILRIDVLRSCGSKRYCIPKSNPFRTTAGAKPEILHLGLRNPWRFSFDPSGRLWIGDVGQDEHEEITRLPAGAVGKNLGWSCWEGDFKYNNSRCKSSVNYKMPLIDIPHAGRQNYTGASVTGGFVYRGSAYPKARGAYIFADFKYGNVWSYQAGDWRAIGQLPMVSGFGENDKGELFAVAYSGEVYRLRF